MASAHTRLDYQTYDSAREIGQQAWDALSDGRPFTSYRWHLYGEGVMADCRPIYLLVSAHGEAIARATFWTITNEPLPLPAWLRIPTRAVLRRRPLLVCRSPLSSTSGLILPDAPLRRPALEAIVTGIQAHARRLSASVILFDYLESDQIAWRDWPEGFAFTSVSDPGTRLLIQWQDFDEYLASTGKKGRQHYKRSLREAGNLGSALSIQRVADRLEESERLVRAVERRHGADHNPWMRGMIAHLDQVHGIWLKATIGERLVGCGVLLPDNGSMLATSLGLAEDVPYVYFQLMYATVEQAIASGVSTLRLGSAAYDFKRRLGCALEDNNHTAFQIRHPLLQRVASRFAGARS